MTMKYFLTCLLLLFVSGCAGGHYYVRDDDPNRTMKTLYKDEQLWIAINPMNGRSSLLMFAARSDDKDISVTVDSVTLTIQGDDNYVRPTKSTFYPKLITLTKGQMYSMVATYNFIAPPDVINAHITLIAKSGGQEISIDETINLNIVEYGFWGALMSI
ncbi:hypothetical protein [Microbulbifer aestuariivivens]|uniref:hypothetical protein n=1 Tax=Microbulbifer aestuariivivens TaxID=1908308 RepID=UPI0031E591E6